MKIRELMSTDVYYVTPVTGIADVAMAMCEHDLSCLPVMTRGRLVGVVTKHDLALRGLAAEFHAATPVREIMTSPPVFCRNTDSLDQLVQLVALHKVRRMPVLDQAGKAVGFITLSDFAPSLAPHRLGELLLLLGEQPAYAVGPQPDRNSRTAQRSCRPPQSEKRQRAH